MRRCYQPKHPDKDPVQPRRFLPAGPLAGEIRGKGIWENDAWAPGVAEEIERLVRTAVKDIGYEQDGFHWETFAFSNFLHGQSPDIAVGVDQLCAAQRQ